MNFDREDFEEQISIPTQEIRIGGMAGGLRVEGIGFVNWTFANGDGTEVRIRTTAYHVPGAKVRLLSPQTLLNRAHGVTGHFHGDQDKFGIHIDGCHPLVVEYDDRNDLPIGYATIGAQHSPQINLALTEADNQNLTIGQKLLLHWHERFGHLNFPRIQSILRAFPFQAARYEAAAKCDSSAMKCSICEFAKGRRRARLSATSSKNPQRDGALKDGHLGPGVRVSVDHFESRLKGRTFDSYGKPSSDVFIGGAIFVDHGSGFIHVEHQVGFSAIETIRAKQDFERMCMDNGVVVQSYLTDSGAFKATNQFVSHIRNHQQRIQYCGTNAHHQNGVAERSIQTISNMARALLQTGSITTQYHVVHDDHFSTVASIGPNDEPPDHWEQLCLENSTYIPVDPSDATARFLGDDWLTPNERQQKQRELQRSTVIRDSFTLPSSLASTAPPPVPIAPPVVPLSVLTPPATVASEGDTSAAITIEAPPPNVQPPIAQGQRPAPSVTPTPIDNSNLRRSSRPTRGTFRTTKYMDEVFLSQIDCGHHPEGHIAQLTYQAELETDLDTGETNIVDPRVFAAKRRTDPDTPSFQQAMKGDDSEEYLKAMKAEIATLVQGKTWVAVPRTPDMHVLLKGTWAFRLKRLPDGTPYRYKARYCVRGDMQQEGVDFFETYAPVVQWSTIRLLFSIVLDESWVTRQVDYTNAFAQADLKETVHIECPRLFAPKSGKTMVLKLIKSLYGLCQAPKTFYDKLAEGLEERGYVKSQIDPCLFMKKGIICVVYVDDTIFAGASADELEQEITALGIRKEEQRHSFALRNEGEVGAFLGVQVEKKGPKEFLLTQTGLIDKVLTASGMNDSRGADTPATPDSIGADLEGPPFAESWNYRTVIGMLMYLSSNSRPDIAYATHAAARFSHAPRHSHAVAVKRILRYLKNTRTMGLHLRPSPHHRVDCYVDADFGGLFGVEDAQDPVSVKSRTGYVIMYRDCPLLWVSKFQTLIALSTQESEYVALSSSLRHLIPIREILKEIMTIVLDSTNVVKYHAHSKAFKDVVEGDMPRDSIIPPSTVYEDNQACLKFARMPKMTPRTKHSYWHSLPLVPDQGSLS